MKQLLIFLLCTELLSGCAATSVNVLEHKKPSKPFSKLLAIYIDGNFELKFLDSSFFNICIQPTLADTNNTSIRYDAEDVLSKKFSSSGTSIVKSSDIFNSAVNSYNDFIKQINDLGIDGILLVSRGSYSHTIHELPSISSPIPNPVLSAVPMGNPVFLPVQTSVSVGGRSYKTPNVTFECYLFKSNTYFPLWKAQLDTKGKGYYNGKAALQNSMAQQLAKSLTDNHYIFR